MTRKHSEPGVGSRGGRRTCLAPGLHLLIWASFWLAACAGPAPAPAQRPRLRLATTTSTADSGLLEAILPDFESRYQAKVDVVAVGTGQALALGSKGDADVVLVHARAKEDQFVADGHGTVRLDVMYNDYVVVGPRDDPAGVGGLRTASEAFAQIAARGAQFVSRGDDSGTHTKELGLWASIQLTPTIQSGWYYSIGQAMGETLLFAGETSAYTLSDRGTWLSQRSRLPGLAVMVGGASIAENRDPALLNPYGVIPVNPARHPGVSGALATRFADWITSEAVQKMIADYGKERYGQPLFYPDSAAWKAAHP